MDCGCERKRGLQGDFRIFDPSNQNDGLAIDQNEKQQIWWRPLGLVTFVMSTRHSGRGLKSMTGHRGPEPAGQIHAGEQMIWGLRKKNGSYQELRWQGCARSRFGEVTICNPVLGIYTGEAKWKCRANRQTCELEFRREVQVEHAFSWALSVLELGFKFGRQDDRTKGDK